MQQEGKSPSNTMVNFPLSLYGSGLVANKLTIKWASLNYVNIIFLSLLYLDIERAKQNDYLWNKPIHCDKRQLVILLKL